MKRLATTLTAIALMQASLSAHAAADLVLVNGRIFTAEQTQPQVQAMAIQGGTILATGNNKEVLALADSNTEILDLAGKRVMPGLIDTHSHAIYGGLSLSSASMKDTVVDLPELEQRLRQWRHDGSARLGPEILQVQGMNSEYWARVEELGQRFNHGEWAETPLILMGSDHHTAWVNARMMQMAGIDQPLLASLPEAERGTIGVLANGQPSGFLVDAGWDRVSAILPPIDTATLMKGAQAAVRYYNSVGVTGWMDPAANASPGQAVFDIKPTEHSTGVLPGYKALAEKGHLSAHVAALLVANPKSRPADLEVLEKVRQQFAGVPNLTLPGVKIFADGVLEFPAQSAALIDPYNNSHKQGELLIDPQHFGKLVTAVDQRGWLMHIHAVGDRAVRESLNGFEQARAAGNSDIAHSITHLQLVHPREFARFKKLNVIASMQLLWATADEYAIDMVKPYVSAFAYHYQYPARSLLKAGATIAGASDWPVSPANPWLAIAQASTRQGNKGVLNASETITRDVMFFAYTLNAAKTLRLDDRIGSLAEGKSADFAILDRDVFSVSEQALSETQVLATYFAGRKVYQRQQ
ncbi:amidohydrolase [Pseudomonas aeruginosa]|uniref:amidohydrolase n=1 Tax=Pseudomonas aeruginosa TaxID=287 RepID=UPI00053D512D|nr:amidohydrolase [Pseudomonas aeruginosa]MCO2031130.1 amidohydrolase [Pseudomonas aeruginosa]MCS7675737.1 amidohydrolase [Pseudomonas aeruginosa]MCS7905044.1 amidohydrolase [Pseudomonas aeruginosa]MCS9345807.1 amidohydrolase [Pseudomonas aeruginosa]MCS9358646.1 amidohydrolase [Pseudomonas aeruginosa]